MANSFYRCFAALPSRMLCVRDASMFLNKCTKSGPRNRPGPHSRPTLGSTISCGLFNSHLHIRTSVHTRPHVQAALLSQVEEKRAKRELERAAKQAEDEEERARVLRVLAEERAANRHR